MMIDTARLLRFRNHHYSLQIGLIDKVTNYHVHFNFLIIVFKKNIYIIYCLNMF